MGASSPRVRHPKNLSVMYDVGTVVISRPRHHSLVTDHYPHYPVSVTVFSTPHGHRNAR